MFIVYCVHVQVMLVLTLTFIQCHSQRARLQCFLSVPWIITKKGKNLQPCTKRKKKHFQNSNILRWEEDDKVLCIFVKFSLFEIYYWTTCHTSYKSKIFYVKCPVKKPFQAWNCVKFIHKKYRIAWFISLHQRQLGLS